jgi:hypothetical protein
MTYIIIIVMQMFACPDCGQKCSSARGVKYHRSPTRGKCKVMIARRRQKRDAAPVLISQPSHSENDGFTFENNNSSDFTAVPASPSIMAMSEVETRILIDDMESRISKRIEMAVNQLKPLQPPPPVGVDPAPPALPQAAQPQASHPSGFDGYSASSFAPELERVVAAASSVRRIMDILQVPTTRDVLRTSNEAHQFQLEASLQYQRPAAPPPFNLSRGRHPEPAFWHQQGPPLSPRIWNRREQLFRQDVDLAAEQQDQRYAEPFFDHTHYYHSGYQQPDGSGFAHDHYAYDGHDNSNAGRYW